MNHYIHAQILNMVAMAKIFEQGCTMAAVRDDGKTSPEEEKAIKKIKAATDKFIKELESIK